MCEIGGLTVNVTRLRSVQVHSSVQHAEQTFHEKEVDKLLIALECGRFGNGRTEIGDIIGSRHCHSEHGERGGQREIVHTSIVCTAQEGGAPASQPASARWDLICQSDLLCHKRSTDLDSRSLWTMPHQQQAESGEEQPNR